jgi:AcrR family transcriptional regulator
MTETARREAKRRQILEGARQAFIEKGFNGATTDVIAATARVSKQTLYSYYPSKEQLVLAVLEQELSAPRRFAVPPLRTREDLERTLSGFARALLDNVAHADTVALLRVIIGEVYRHEALRREMRRLLPLRFLGAVRETIVAAERQGLVSAPHPELAARLFAGSVLSFVMLDAVLADGPPTRPDDETLGRLVGLFMRTLAVD